MANLLTILKGMAITAGAVFGGIALAWSGGALYYDLPASAGVRTAVALLWVAGCPAVLICRRLDWRALAGAGAVFAAILGWWLTLTPSQDRDWKPEMSQPAWAEVEGDTVRVYNVRNNHFRTADDFDLRYETRTYSLSQLRGLDVIQTYWGAEYMAHPLLSFDFGPQGRLVFSIEARYEKGEAYDPIGGLYRRFELMIVTADERDVIRLRTNIRPGEDCYLYSLKLPPEMIRRRFLDYMAALNRLRERPEWYNSLTQNCTTSIRGLINPDERAAWDWRMLANGYIDRMFYERGILDTSLPFDELKKRAYINARGKAAGDSPDYSEQIRRQSGDPGMR